MSLQSQRVIYDSGLAESDISVLLNDFRTETYVVPLAVGRYLYIASELPFNHRHIEVSVANATTAAITVEIWFARAWYSALDIVDGTSTNAKTLAKSGIIEWKTDINRGWDRELHSNDVTGISKTGIYGMYWMRFGVDATISATTALKYVGHKFCTDEILYTYYPDLNNTALKTAFATGKTNWNDQHFMAVEHIVRDLRCHGLALSVNQVIDYRILEAAAAHKAAEIIYAGMGRAYVDDLKRAAEKYSKAINIKKINLDCNANALLDDGERIIDTGYMTR